MCDKCWRVLLGRLACLADKEDKEPTPADRKREHTGRSKGRLARGGEGGGGGGGGKFIQS